MDIVGLADGEDIDGGGGVGGVGDHIAVAAVDDGDMGEAACPWCTPHFLAHHHTAGIEHADGGEFVRHGGAERHHRPVAGLSEEVLATGIKNNGVVGGHSLEGEDVGVVWPKAVDKARVGVLLDIDGHVIDIAGGEGVPQPVVVAIEIHQQSEQHQPCCGQ